MSSVERLPGSFRDPAGQIFRADGRLLRTVTGHAARQFEVVRPVLQDLVSRERLVAFAEHFPAECGFSPEDISVVLEHPVIATWTYPYEWSFALLRDAALFHLDLHLELLDKGCTLSDASAYNIQFVGVNPIFIDHLSIRPYRDGEFWMGHRQFCEQFLNPLLMRAYLDVAPNAWYRGALEGISTIDLAKLLPFRAKARFPVLTNVVLPARFQRGSTSEKAVSHKLRERKLPLAGFRSMLLQLRRFIDLLRPANTSATTWANYASTTTYDDAETASKKQFVASFIRNAKASHVVDLGCNTGDYSKVCLEAGATRVTGFDFDQQSLDSAHERAKSEKLNFLALYLDARNPSPNQGWLQEERTGFAQRFSADAVIALAFEHHLAIAHNAPLDDVVKWIIGVAPCGIIEFVPKSDPTIQKMLALREDIFLNYDEGNFVRAVEARGKITDRKTVSSTGRTLYAFERRQ